MMSPLVSVVVPSYNHEKFLKERIDSIVNQTFQDFELIILDDLSPDNSREIIERYRTHPKVSKIVYNEKNSGSTFFQWNKAIFELAQGEFIWIAESDDVAESNFLETLVPVLKNDQEIVLAYCQSARMDSEGKITGSWKDWTDTLPEGKIFEHSFTMDGYEYIEKYLIHKNTVPNASAVLFKKDAYKKVGGAEKNQKTTGDWHLWIKIIMNGKVYFSASELNKFRYHEKSVIARATTINEKSKLSVKYNLLDNILNMRFQLKNEKIFLVNSKFKNISKINNRVLRNIRIKKSILKFFLIFS
ncbi:glycosyltransferase family 2 protein [Acinetobacter ursingii]|uniref:glycosyltransferase family 2 protein n=2 Tax=Acinetobacter ursingii TaxID=108980 RepID=UPI00300B2AB5